MYVALKMEISLGKMLLLVQVTPGCDLQLSNKNKKIIMMTILQNKHSVADYQLSMPEFIQHIHYTHIVHTE